MGNKFPDSPGWSSAKDFFVDHDSPINRSKSPEKITTPRDEKEKLNIPIVDHLRRKYKRIDFEKKAKMEAEKHLKKSKTHSQLSTPNISIIE